MRILALDDYGNVFLKSKACGRLRAAGHEVHGEPQALRGSALISAAASAEALLLTQQRTPLSQSLLLQLPKLRYILNTGRNAAHVDAEALRERDIQLVLAGGGNPHPAAEMTWALIFAAARRLVENVQSCRSGQWQSQSGWSLHGKTLGLYGLGNIGSIVASVGRALGMQVLCHGRAGGASEQEALAKGYEFVTKDALFQRSDVLSLHLKYSAETHGTVTRSDLASMKPTALFVNTARAGLVEQGALLSSLQAGQPGFAALDVFDQEPLELEEPLLKLSNVLCTPHLGYVTEENMEDYYDGVVTAFLEKTQSAL